MDSQKELLEEKIPRATTMNTSSKREKKVDLISDVIKFVSELNNMRYTGDTLMMTLTRMLKKTFIEKYEYDSKMKLLPNAETLMQTKNSIDRLTMNQDMIDVRLRQNEQLTADTQILITACRDELEFKASKQKIDQQINGLATIAQLREVDRKFLKFAMSEDIQMLKTRIDIMKEEVVKSAKSEDISRLIDKLLNDINESNQKYVTREALDSRLSIYDAKIMKIKKNFKNQFHLFKKLEEDLESTNKKFDKVVSNVEFEEEIDKIWNNFKTYSNFCQFRHLKEHMDKVDPILQSCTHLLEKYKKDNQASKEIIHRFDEVLLQKASKFSVDKVEKELKAVCLKTSLEELKQEFEKKVQKNQDNIVNTREL